MVALLVAACFSGALPAVAAITYLGSGTIPANTFDDSGLTGLLENGAPGNRAGGMGSAIAYSGSGNLFFMTPDRGPGDGSNSWVDRVYQVQITIVPSGPNFTVTPTLGHATLLRNESGTHFLGLSSAFDPTNSPASLRLDPEGVRVGPSGSTAFIGDEYGPFVYEFDLASGRRLRTIAVAPRFLIANPDASTNGELPPGNTSGRQANRSMECLAITPDGGMLYGLVQSPLIQDGALSGGNNRIGTNCRLLEMDLTSGATREFLYPLSSASVGATDLLAINDHEFLVLERDGKGLNSGNTAQFKQLFRIDIAGATDISGVASLPSTAIPAGVTPVTKSLFLDILAATGIPGNQFPEKLEGLAFGPDLPDGRHVLVVSADNDFLLTIANWFFAFAIDPESLPGYMPQTIAQVVGVGGTPPAAGLALGAPVPQPSRGGTRFDYALPRDGHARLALFDVGGRLVRRLLDGARPTGAGSVHWDGRDESGCDVPAGSYFARLEAHGARRIRKVIVVER